MPKENDLYKQTMQECEGGFYSEAALEELGQNIVSNFIRERASDQRKTARREVIAYAPFAIVLVAAVVGAHIDPSNTLLNHIVPVDLIAMLLKPALDAVISVSANELRERRAKSQLDQVVANMQRIDEARGNYVEADPPLLG